MLGQKRKLDRRSMFKRPRIVGIPAHRRGIVSTIHVRGADGHRRELEIPCDRIDAVMEALRALVEPKGNPAEPPRGEPTVNSTDSPTTPDPNPSPPDQLPPFNPWSWENPSFRDEQVFQDYMAILERNRLADVMDEENAG